MIEQTGFIPSPLGSAFHGGRNLVLPGRTQGSQFNNALFMLVGGLGIAGIQGLHRKGDVFLYVTRGIVTSKFEDDLR
jgi:hypothetical protein